jgi:Sec7-like guanine-nucleotide exchange factor
MVVTLLSNLYSHYKSMLDSDATIKDIDEENYDKIFQNIDKRNIVINRLNRISIWSLIIGITLIISFATINIYNMNDSNQNGKPTPSPQPKPLTEEKGRTTPIPPKNNPTNYPKK